MTPFKTLMITAASLMLTSGIAAAQEKAAPTGMAPQSAAQALVNEQTPSANDPGTEFRDNAALRARVEANAETPALATTAAQLAATEPAAGASFSTTDKVRDLQQRLSMAGHSVSVDGVLGTQTRNALRSFQQANGLPATGRVNNETVTALNSQ